MKRKVAIIGAGASGMVCAITAASGNNTIKIFDKNSRAGRKILATGNGRCNISNTAITMEHYHGHHPSFVRHALKQFDRDKMDSFFRSLGLELTGVEDGRLFPMSLQASSVVDFLEFACRKKGVTFVFESEVLDITPENGGYKLSYEGGRERFDAVVIASGSGAMPSLGSNESGYTFAQKVGHRFYDPFPVLVQLISADKQCTRASGVKVDAVLSAVIDHQTEQTIRGDLLFTNYGLSGLAILDLSRTISSALYHGRSASVRIDFLPDMPLPSLKKALTVRAKTFSSMPSSLLLNGLLHKKIVAMLFEKLHIDGSKALSGKPLQSLAYEIKNFEVKIADTRGPKGAEVMAGGVDCSEIDPKTMESRLHSGLFFTGEVVDIDGDRGGYNLHWAWASGYLAGKRLSL